MNAVLSEPVLPESFPDQEYLTGLIKSVIRENPEIVEKIIIDLLEDDPNFKEHVSDLILTSNSNFKKRLQILEEITGMVDKFHLGEKEETLPEQMDRKIETITKPLLCEFSDSPKTLADIRTDILVNHLLTGEGVPKFTKENGENEYYVNSKVFRYFVENVLPENLRPRTMKNLRKLKKDLIENAVLRHEGKVWKDQSKYGNRELRLVTVRKKALLSVTE